MTALEPIKKDIIDNTGDAIMRDILNSEIPRAGRLDVSTGYFNVAGYGMLRGTLEKRARDGSFAVRMLLGKDAIVPSPATFEGYAERHRQAGAEPDAPEPLKTSIDGTDLAPEPLADTSGLLNLLERPNVQVRQGKNRFNHSKCYILGSNAVFIGSSNLTAGGLAGNYELNAGLYQPGTAGATRKWFDRMWEGAADAKEEMIGVLKQSKFGAPADPYDVYMKMLYEKFKPFLRPDDGKPRPAEELAAFQRDAVSTAVHVMSNHGGAIIADSTGLGKTNMAMEIMRQKVLDEGRKVMLVAPAQVLRGMWGEKLKDAGVMVKREATMESMGREDFLDNPGRYSGIDLVVVDESQNFRSKSAQRRINLMRMLAVGKQKQVLLLTATPINNSLMDLYYQLSIITQNNDDHFWEAVGIPDLYKHMRDATNRDLQGGLGKIEQLLDSVMIRRTRSFIRQVYPDDRIRGSPVRFPEHEYRPIRYDLAKLFGNVFDKLYRGIKSLTMAPYGIERYNTDLTDEERDAHAVLAHLQVVLLLKRFESSIRAVRISIDNKVRMYEFVRSAVQQGRLPRAADFSGELARWNAQEIDSEGDGEEEREGRLAERVSGMETEKMGKNYDRKSMLADIDSDLKTLRRLEGDLAGVTLDRKLDAVVEAVAKDGALEREGRKALIFTEYAATAKYVHDRMREAFPDKEVLLIHGGTRPETRQSHVRRFAPAANLPEGEELAEKEADMLVSTEVLSEGQNLQDCNYVISYDLPWNPMRIVQRTGRIDRLTSRHGTIRSRACYPDRQLDDLLKLLGKLARKIDTAQAVVGGYKILDKDAGDKVYNGTIARDMRVLAGLEGGEADLKKAVERLETSFDMMPRSTPLNEIIRHVKEIGFDAMGAAPMGRRSGRKGEGRKAVLAYLQDGKAGRVHFAVYDYATDTAEVPGSDTDAIRLAACERGTPLHLPMDGDEHKESFKELLRIDALARQAIANRDRDGGRTLADLQKRRNKHDKNVSDLVGVLVNAAVGGVITHEDAEAARLMLESEQARSWPSKPKELLAEYGESGDPKMLVADIKKFAKSICYEERPERSVVPDRDAKLKLIGAMFVTGGPDPGKGKRGLDRHLSK